MSLKMFASPNTKIKFSLSSLRHTVHICKTRSICEYAMSPQQHIFCSHAEPHYRWTCPSPSQTCCKCLMVGTRLCLPPETHPKPDGCLHCTSKPAMLSLAALKVMMVYRHTFKHPPVINQLLSFHIFLYSYIMYLCDHSRGLETSTGKSRTLPSSWFLSSRQLCDSATTTAMPLHWITCQSPDPFSYYLWQDLKILQLPHLRQ